MDRGAAVGPHSIQRLPGTATALRENIGVLSYYQPGAGAPGGPQRAIELVREDDWKPPERTPWNSRARLAVAALVLAAVSLIYVSGVAQPTGLLPTLDISGKADAIALDGGLAYVVRRDAITAHRVSDGTVAWSRPMPGPAATVVNLPDHRLLLSTMDAPQRTALQVVDSVSGAVKWTSGSRLVGLAGDVVVVGGERNAEGVRLAGLEQATGDVVWSTTIPVWTIVARPSAQRGSPTARLTDQAELSIDGRLAIRNLETGRIRARAAMPSGVMPTSVSIAGRVVVVATGAGIIHAYDAVNMRPLWKRPTPVAGYYSQFTVCGQDICHINDRGTVALDRESGKTMWQAPVRYHALPVDDGHLFVSELFRQYADSSGGVLDPESGELIHELSPWTAFDVIDGNEMLVWRRDGQRRVIVGLFDAHSGHTRVVGRTTAYFGAPGCVAGGGFVLCAGDQEVVGWAA